jgi:hypothetical protein
MAAAEPMKKEEEEKRQRECLLFLLLAPFLLSLVLLFQMNQLNFACVVGQNVGEIELNVRAGKAGTSSLVRENVQSRAFLFLFPSPFTLSSIQYTLRLLQPAEQPPHIASGKGGWKGAT